VSDSVARRTQVRATLLIAASACCFGSIAPLTVIALKSGAALQSIQAWRYLTTAIVLTAYAMWRPSPARLSVAGTSVNAASVAPWYAPQVLLIAGGGQATIATLALLALRWIPASTTAFLFYTYPAWVALIFALRGIEPLTGHRVAALALAIGGITAMVGAPSSAALHPLGLVCILSAALVYALYIPVLNSLQRQRPALDVARAIAVGGGLLFLIWAIVTNSLVAHHDVRSMLASLLQGVLSAGAFLGFLSGLARLGPVRTAITSTVEPFWTTMVGIVVLGQPLGAGTLVGGAAIMTAVLLLQRPDVASARLHSSSLHAGDQPGPPTP
jgi:drug/metabolite transporter (DMT)-like permease